MRGFVLLGAVALIGAAPPITAEMMGPAPTFEQARDLGERAIRATLIDPDSAKFEWPYNFVGGSLKPLFGHTTYGFYTCGFVNAKNRMGGYAGAGWFLIMERAGVVTSIDVSNPDQITPASATCPDLVKNGTLPPAPQPVAESVSTGPGPLGVQFQPTPYGAMIAIVAPGSVADKVGLKPGEVIESVNGIPIKGMAPADMIKVVAAPTASTFGIIGSGEVRVRP